MAGAGEDWLSDGLDDVVGVESGLWVSGVDYVAGWRVARVAAERLNRALLGAGLELSAVRAVASTDVEGRGVVRLAGLPDAVERLAGLLESVADGDGGAV
ncbi:hypothetical protein F9278_14165 [Streptomyces phaeolivaceus]|uniref:Uncharacterized protein n=1 Tax=Streptomyces phaeolivaceus TaxID=2653200 RepID=A0A5P8K291_9ACTN|nr:hypothetical protein [Streptomyces phaeolivaceus]QFQ97166.1 hypothetical protein F9278_14165 [Streptomyces phaeolivaceus]